MTDVSPTESFNRPLPLSGDWFDTPYSGIGPFPPKPSTGEGRHRRQRGEESFGYGRDVTGKFSGRARPTRHSIRSKSRKSRDKEK